MAIDAVNRAADFISIKLNLFLNLYKNEALYFQKARVDWLEDYADI